jgi:hypothetical protein
MKRFNKATAAALAGALITAIAAVWPLDSELQGALQTVMTTALVWLVPNIEPAATGRQT